ncbi:MAG: hypothetical protein JOZ93_03285, partial [Sinobacteraceae bacterium]|nr:hypothetical protein [Nevskiaceae bacterium]
PYSWTRVDLLVRALLRAPLKAFTGEGKPAASSGTALDRAGTWIPTQHIKVRQLYIPGLCKQPQSARPDQDARALYERAFAWPADIQPLLRTRERRRLVSP